MLEVLLQSLPQRIGNLVESNKLLNPQHVDVISRGPRVQALDDGGNVTKDTGVHQGWKTKEGSHIGFILK